MENENQEKQIKKITKQIEELKKDYQFIFASDEGTNAVSYTHLRAHETDS